MHNVSPGVTRGCAQKESHTRGWDEGTCVLKRASFRDCLGVRAKDTGPLLCLNRCFLGRPKEATLKMAKARARVGEAHASGKKERGRALVLYPVELETDAAEWAEARRPIVAHKRYSDFHWLKARLESESAAVLPPLPPKQLMHTRRVLRERALSLQSFLDFVTSDRSLLSSPSFAAFLEAEPFPASSSLCSTTAFPDDSTSPSQQSEQQSALSNDTHSFSDNPLEIPLKHIRKHSFKSNADSASSTRRANARQRREHMRRHPRTDHSQSLAAINEPPPLAQKHLNHSSSSHTASALSPLDDATDDAADGYEVSGEGVREAIKAQDAACVRAVLAKGAEPDFKDDKGMSLLHIAAMFDNKAIVDSLLNAGAQPDAQNSQGETPADCAPLVLSAHIRECARTGTRPISHLQQQREERERLNQQRDCEQQLEQLPHQSQEQRQSQHHHDSEPQSASGLHTPEDTSTKSQGSSPPISTAATIATGDEDNLSSTIGIGDDDHLSTSLHEDDFDTGVIS